MSTAITSNCCCIHGDTGSRTGHNFSLVPSVLTLALLFLLFYSNHVSLYLFACEAILLYSDCFHIACVSSFVLKNSVQCHINFTACFSIESVGKLAPVWFGDVLQYGAVCRGILNAFHSLIRPLISRCSHFQKFYAVFCLFLCGLSHNVVNL